MLTSVVTMVAGVVAWIGARRFGVRSDRASSVLRAARALKVLHAALGVQKRGHRIDTSLVQCGPQRWDMRRGRSLRAPDLPQLRTAAKCIVQKCAEPFWAALLRLRPRRFASDARCGRAQHPAPRMRRTTRELWLT